MGYSMRTQNHRLVIWRDHRDANAAPLYTELYDHRKDPTETTNIANKNQKLVTRLTKQLNRTIR